MERYDKRVNHMGSTRKQKKFTKSIVKKHPKINFISWIHDSRYKLSLTYRDKGLFIISKFIMDLEFLVTGVYLNLFAIRWRLDKNIEGSIIVILSYVAILLYTPIYFKKHFLPSKTYTREDLGF